MPSKVESPINSEQLHQATNNYLRCLNLSPNSQVLLITDKPNPFDDNAEIRRKMVDLLTPKIRKNGLKAVNLRFNNGTTEEEFYEETQRTLQELDELDDGSDSIHDTTIVYLGDAWQHRKGIHDAINEFAEMRKVRLADSLRFTTGDCRVMSQINEKKMVGFKEIDKYFNDFFEEKPKGRFEIVTQDLANQKYTLQLSYDTSAAPFQTRMGTFENDSELTQEGWNFELTKIPGAEKTGAPFPYNKAIGQFYSDGLIFWVREGLVKNVHFTGNKMYTDLDQYQKLVVDMVERDEYLPVSELGLGFYELAGISIYSDSSMLTKEKAGPHIGIGESVTQTKESWKIKMEAKKFNHADFVLEKATIFWTDLDRKNRQQFYPPEE